MKIKNNNTLMIVWFFLMTYPFLSETCIPLKELRKSEKKMLDLVNIERGKCGTDKLTFNSRLYKVAMAHNVKMADEDILAHNFHQYKKLSQRMIDVNLFFCTAGENIAFSDTFSSKEIHDAFVKSPSHHENLINKNFKQCGIAILETDRGFYITQEFAEIILPISEENILKKMNESIGKWNLFCDKDITDKMYLVHGKILNNLSKQLLCKGVLKEIPKSLEGFDMLTVISNKIEDIELSIKNSNKERTFGSYAMGITFGRNNKYPGGALAVVFILRKKGVAERLSTVEIEKKLLQMFNKQMIEFRGTNLTNSKKLSNIADKVLKAYYKRDNLSHKYNKYNIIAFQISETLEIPKEHLNFLLANKKKKIIGIKVHRPTSKSIPIGYLLVSFVFEK